MAKKQSKPTYPRFIDIEGQRFGRLVVLFYVGHRCGRAHWLCRCDCGEQRIVFGCHLRNGHTRSCGCLREDRIRKHGRYETKEYKAWEGLRGRCSNSNHHSYKDYGGRGIAVCERWQGQDGFENFFADMGEAPSALYSIDRIDNAGDYCPENCRWATPQEQSRNMRSNINVTINGQTQCLQAWVNEFGIHYATVRFRMSRGWPAEQALTLPVKQTINISEAERAKRKQACGRFQYAVRQGKIIRPTCCEVCGRNDVAIRARYLYHLGYDNTHIPVEWLCVACRRLVRNRSEDLQRVEL